MSKIGCAAVVATLVMALCGSACSKDDDGGGTALRGGESEVLGDADEGIDGVQSIRVYYEDPVHAESVIDYDLRPPAGGIHNSVWWNCGFYDEAMPDEHVVHALEHGAVWLAYDPDLDPADVEAIQELAGANPKVIAAPYPDLAEGEAVVATAWARQLRVDSAGDPRLAEFVDQYQDGSQAPESGASCAGGLGEPIP
jgi:hypothetical protein